MARFLTRAASSWLLRARYRDCASSCELGRGALVVVVGAAAAVAEITGGAGVAEDVVVGAGTMNGLLWP